MTPFKLQIVTPDKILFDGMTEGIIVRTTVGDKGILAKHEPYVAALVIGKMKVKIDGAYRTAAVSAGVVKVSRDKTTVLTQSCEWSDEIDVGRAERARADAEQALTKAADDRNAYDIAEFKLKRALNRIDAANNK